MCQKGSIENIRKYSASDEPESLQRRANAKSAQTAAHESKTRGRAERKGQKTQWYTHKGRKPKTLKQNVAKSLK